MSVLVLWSNCEYSSPSSHGPISTRHHTRRVLAAHLTHSTTLNTQQRRTTDTAPVPSAPLPGPAPTLSTLCKLTHTLSPRPLTLDATPFHSPTRRAHFGTALSLRSGRRWSTMLRHSLAPRAPCNPLLERAFAPIILRSRNAHPPVPDGNHPNMHNLANPISSHAIQPVPSPCPLP